jgi:predicted xylose isomerase-like sugar epimerase
MTEPSRFALNHMAAPRKQFPEFAALARSLGITDVEIRNDLAGVAIADGTAAERVRQQAATAGIGIVSINALQRFNLWDEERETAAMQRSVRPTCITPWSGWRRSCRGRAPGSRRAARLRGKLAPSQA